MKAEVDKKQDKMTVDTALSTTSTNTVQNKVVTAELNKKLNLSGGTITGQLVLSKTTDLSGASNNTPALIVGGVVTAQHLEFDGNEIMSKKNANTVGDLFINTEGGLVGLGTVASADSTNNQFIPNNDAGKNLGSTSRKWKDAYLSGNILLDGGTASHYRAKNKGIARGTAPSGNTYHQPLQLLDMNDKTIGAIEIGLLTDKRSLVNLICYKGTDAADNSNARIEVGWDKNGNIYTFAPTPAASSNTTNIATTAWVRTFMLNTLYPVGTIYISTKKSCAPASLGGTWNLVDEGYALWTTKTDNAGGTTVAAGLPNITGKISYYGYSSGDTEGAIHGTWISSSKQVGDSASNKNYLVSYFNANNGATTNGIYGNSTTVQPPAYKIYAYRRDA